MTIFDIIIVIIIISAFVKGLFKGFVIELATLAALIAGIAGAVLFSGFLANKLSGTISSQYVPLISFIILFTVIVICVHLLAKLINSLLKAVSLGWLNKIAGGFFSVFKIVMVVSIILLILDVIGLKTKLIPLKYSEKSMLYTPVERLAPAVFDLFKLKYEHLLPETKEEEKTLFLA